MTVVGQKCLAFYIKTNIVCVAKIVVQKALIFGT
jgi:hypothetical protein